jgi:hypothetical protein
MTMSWVAEAKATARANSARLTSWVVGSENAMPASAAMMVSWENSIQLRRRPIQRDSQGSGSRSTSGDHSHLTP